MTWIPWFLASITAFWIVGALVGAMKRDSITLSLIFALLGSLLAAGFGLCIWLGWLPIEAGKDYPIPLDFWQGLNSPPYSPRLQLIFGLDTLSAFFLFLVSAFSSLIALYSFRALDADHYRPYRHWIVSDFNLFCLTTALVLLARDGFSLLLALELMTLSFGYLVLYKHYYTQDYPNHFNDRYLESYRVAPQVYLMISHTSTAFLMLAILLLSIHAQGSTSFADWRNLSSSWSGTTLPNIVFILALIGLGIRAGLTPAHVWVPLVHPSSPTTIHAFSLGIAIKVALYLMYRFFFEFLPWQPWWGYMLLGIGVFTAFINVWYAIFSHDLKEALAYHSIENIGIISAGIGLGLIFWKIHPPLAYLGLLASLYHILNHAVFKGLLYLATGAIDNLTHQNVDIDQLGGLIHRYQFTAGMFLIGSFAISGFPPLNGFVSEWLILKAGLQGLSLLDSARYIISFAIILFSLILLVASFALTAFCFYKLAGIALLGLPRLPEEERQEWEHTDVATSMKAVMGLTAVLCLALGIFPSFVVPHLIAALQPLHVPLEFAAQIDWSLLSFTPTEPSAAHTLPVLPLGVIGIGVLVLVLAFFLRFAFRISARSRLMMDHPAGEPDEPWNCGEPISEPPVHLFSSGGLSYWLRELMAFLNPTVSDGADYLPARLYLSASEDNPQVVIEIFRLAYNQLTSRLLHFSESFALWLQNGDIRRYMSYVFVANLLVVIFYWLTSGLLGGE